MRIFRIGTFIVAAAIAVATWVLVNAHKPQAFTKHCSGAHFTEGLAWWTLVVRGAARAPCLAFGHSVAL